MRPPSHDDNPGNGVRRTRIHSRAERITAGAARRRPQKLLIVYQFTDAMLAVRRGPFFNGLKLFDQQDVDIFAAREALGLQPQPDLVTYQ